MLSPFGSPDKEGRKARAGRQKGRERKGGMEGDVGKRV